MHRQTPLTAAFVAYTGGGARTIIDKIDDGKMMQQMTGAIMGESRESVECPQNYGFSSVVRAGKKGEDGQMEEGAEGFMSYFGGNRTSNFCGVMDDRRHRPMGMKEGENAQYDDLGQMTLLRRSGVYILTLDSEDDSQKSSGGGGGGAGVGLLAGDSGGGGGEKKERFVSLRHVEKKKQERQKRGGGDSAGGNGGGAGSGGSGGSGGSVAGLEIYWDRDGRIKWRDPRVGDAGGASGGAGGDEYKHEGETVNLEVRVSKKRIEFRSGEDVVGYYDKESNTWLFTSGGDESKSLKVDGSHTHMKCGGNHIWVDTGGCWSSKPIEIKPDPSAADPTGPSMLERLELQENLISALASRVAELESRA
jgi:hypothetical protein